MNNPTTPETEAAFRQVLWHLKPFLGELVLIGGWVPHLYRQYGGFDDWQSHLSSTTELDLLVATRRESTQSIADTLREANFTRMESGAIWVGGEPEARIEFMTNHTGTAMTRSRVIPVRGDEGLQALALTGLDLLQRFTDTLNIQIGILNNEVQSVEIQVPTLGAYIVNKAITFPYRPNETDETGGSKANKDVLYLRDVMAAGDTVIERVSRNIAAIVDAGLTQEVEKARSNTYLLQSSMQRYVDGAAAVLAERDRVTFGTAKGDVMGHITDLHEMLQEALDTRTPH